MPSAVFVFGFIGGLKIEIVGADVLDGPMPTREDSLSGKGYLRGVEMPSMLDGRPLHLVNIAPPINSNLPLSPSCGCRKVVFENPITAKQSQSAQDSGGVHEGKH